MHSAEHKLDILYSYVHLEAITALGIVCEAVTACHICEVDRALRFSRILSPRLHAVGDQKLEVWKAASLYHDGRL